MPPIDLYCITFIIPLLFHNITTNRSNRVLELTPINGGKPVNISAYNYIASISYQDQHICSAIILNEDWLLTPAHCIRKYKHKDLKIVAGVSDLLHPTLGTIQQRNVTNIIIHEKYGSKTGSSVFHNLALIRVQESFNMSTNIGKGKISNIRDRQINRYFVSCNVLGWGSKRDVDKDGIDSPVKSMESNNLFSVELYLLPDGLCEKLFLGQDAKDFICIGTLDNFYPKCPSDGGGPVICMNMIVGIPSYNTDFCHIMLFTRTDSYSDWMKHKMKKLNKILESKNRYEKRKSTNKNCQACVKLKKCLLQTVISCFLLHFLH